VHDLEIKYPPIWLPKIASLSIPDGSDKEGVPVPRWLGAEIMESNMILSSEMLDYIRFLGVQIGRFPDHYTPSDRFRALIYSALECYRGKYIAPERREEFYTIAVAALQDGEQEGKLQLQQAHQLMELNDHRLSAGNFDCD
jgi:hypothetical protein